MFYWGYAIVCCVYQNDAHVIAVRREYLAQAYVRRESELVLNTRKSDVSNALLLLRVKAYESDPKSTTNHLTVSTRR